MLSHYDHEMMGKNASLAKMSLARAKYDNLAESPDELAFRKGDILTVLEQKIDGLNGWWLCGFRGRQGIVPANRLKLLAGMYNERSLRFSTSPDSSISDGGGQDYDVPRATKMSTLSAALSQSSIAGSDTYDVPKSTTSLSSGLFMNATPSDDLSSFSLIQGQGHQFVRTSALSPASTHQSTDSAVMSGSNRSSFISSVYASSSNNGAEQYLTYDVPQSVPVPVTSSGAMSLNLYDTPNPSPQKVESRDSGVYDNSIPPTASVLPSIPPTSGVPPTAGTAPTAGLVDPKPGSFHIPGSGIRNQSVDSPYQQHKQPPAADRQPVYDSPTATKADSSHRPLLAASLSTDTYDIPKSSKDLSSDLPVTYADLDRQAATNTLVKLQQAMHMTIAQLLSFSKQTWRASDSTTNIPTDLQQTISSFHSHLNTFSEFCTHCLRLPAKEAIKHRLESSFSQISDKRELIQRLVVALRDGRWSVKPTSVGDRDPLTQLFTLSSVLNDDVADMASLLHANSVTLFDKPSVAEEPQILASHVTADVAEYDYCELREPEIDLSAIKPPAAFTDSTDEDKVEDTKYTQFYISKIKTISQRVRQNYSALQHTIQLLTFESRAKLVRSTEHVIVSAHQLVYVADSLCRVLRNSATVSKVAAAASALGSLLKELVVKVKEVVHCDHDNQSFRSALGRLEKCTSRLLNQIYTFGTLLDSRS